MRYHELEEIGRQLTRATESFERLRGVLISQQRREDRRARAEAQRLAATVSGELGESAGWIIRAAVAYVIAYERWLEMDNRDDRSAEARHMMDLALDVLRNAVHNDGEAQEIHERILAEVAVTK